MISVKVSKNVDDYKENVLGTMDMKKTVAVLKGVAVGGVIMAVLSFFHVPMIIAGYASVPVLFFFIYRGFYEKDGMTYEEAKRLKKEHTYDGANFPCASGNDQYVYQELIRQYKKEHEMESHIRSNDDFNDFFASMKKYLLIGGLAVITLGIVFVLVLLMS